MELIKDTTDFKLHYDTAAAIGKFDGVHIGHRKLLEEILAKKQEGLKACVFTFDPPPAVLFGFSDGKELTTREEKREIFEKMGVDILIEFPLTRVTADIAAEEFVKEYLCKRMRVRFLAAGEDVSFGRKGAGNAKLLQRLSGTGVFAETIEMPERSAGAENTGYEKAGAEKAGYELKLIEKICVEGVEVSSTKIRDLIEHGDMERARKLSGAPYTISGEVVHGNRVGRTIGFPTVNIVPPEHKLLPPNGVYSSRVKIGDRSYKAISNVGCKPTVSNQPKMGVESFLYDFDEDIYGQWIEVELQSFKRPERKFAGLEELKEQLAKDIG